MKYWGLKNRLIFQTVLPTIVVTIFLGCYFTFVRTRDLQENLIARGALIQTQLTAYATYSIESQQSNVLDDWIIETEKNGAIEDITIYQADGVAIAGGSKQVLTQDDIINLNPSITNTVIKQNGLFVFINQLNLSSASTPPANLTHKKQQIYPAKIDIKHRYWAVITLSDAPYELQIFYAILALIIAFSCGVLIAILFGYKIAQEVAYPIIEAVKSVDAIKHGDFSIKMSVICQGEMALLKDGINNMASQLKNVHKIMRENIQKATQELRDTLKRIAIQNDELDEARKEALIASRAKSEFLANMSHEIRTPMNSIIGFTDLLLKTNISKAQKDYLTTIDKSSKNLLTIINDVLDLSKIEAGSLELHLEEFNLEEIVNDVITMLSPQSLQKNLEISLNISKDIPKFIIQDALRLQQVLTNLLNNAIKFTNKGNIKLRVNLISKEYHNYTLKFEIQDTGIGLTKSEVKKLFSSFSQADNSTTRKFGGTGLGLVISKNLVEKMSGTIGVESVHKQGSTFWFTIICQTPIESEKSKIGIKENIDDQSTSTKFIKTSKIKIISKKKHLNIISVDDNAVNLKLISSILETFGHKVNSFGNAHNAISNIKNKFNEIDLIFMDLQMPNIDGFKAAKTIFGFLKDKNKDIPIIALTADVFAETKEKIIQTGFHGYQTKPITVDQINKIINQYFEITKTQNNTEETKTKNIAKNITEEQTKPQVKTQTEAKPPLLDFNQALSLTGGNEELVKEMQQMLLEELISETKKIKKYFEDNDIKKVRFIAHKIQGGASYCGTVRLKDGTNKVERLCYTIEKEDSKELRKELSEAFLQLLDTIEKTIDALKP